ncbi:DUF3352 domain-containing protein, partial [Aeromicrobium wangtongii]|uniref:DUF3352 domain-containing protein n=1 Tax=Aeromicrobium wangtongii TaxID=2969247 RepID=UPI001E36E71A
PPGPPAPPSSGSGAKKGFVGVVAAAVLLGGGYGAYAVYDRLDGGGPQPHDVLPASTDAYLRLDLDPSASQKMDLFKLVREFPDVADELGIKSDDQDIRELVFKQVLSKECDGLDYDDDVEPWLGERIGVGLDVEDGSFLIAVQTTDEKASRQGIKKLFACADDTYGIAYLDGYAILAPKQAEVDAAVKATEKAPLGDDKDFVKDFEQLGDQGVVSSWMDLEAIAKLPEFVESGGSQAAELAEAGSAAMTLRVDGSAVELAVLGGPEQKTSSKVRGLADLPADTLVALSVSGVGDQVTEGYDTLMQELDKQLPVAATPVPPVARVTPDAPDAPDAPSSPLPQISPVEPPTAPGGFGSFDPRRWIEQLEQSSGLQLPEDLGTLFGDNLTLALGAKNLETIPQMSGPEDLSTLDVALSLTSDPAKALDLVQRLATLSADGGVPMVASPTDDGAVLATNQDAADAITKGDGKLGDDKVFRSVIPDGDAASGGLYVNVGALLDKILEADPPKDVRDGIKEAKAISAVGVSVSKKDDRPLTSLRIAFDK